MQPIRIVESRGNRFRRWQEMWRSNNEIISPDSITLSPSPPPTSGAGDPYASCTCVCMPHGRPFVGRRRCPRMLALNLSGAAPRSFTWNWNRPTIWPDALSLRAWLYAQRCISGGTNFSFLFFFFFFHHFLPPFLTRVERRKEITQLFFSLCRTGAIVKFLFEKSILHMLYRGKKSHLYEHAWRSIFFGWI